MNATKFTFDTVFDGGVEVVSDAARARRKRSLTEAEIAQLCEDAKAEGMRAGEVRAQEAIAAGARETVNAIGRALAQMAQERRMHLEQGKQLAFALARKLAGAALEALPHADVEAALREAMHQAIGEPRIVLKAAPGVAAALAPRLAEIAHEEGFDGKVQVTADPNLTRADCRIEWRGGGAERAESALEGALKRLIGRELTSADEQGADHDRQ